MWCLFITNKESKEYLDLIIRGDYEKLINIFNHSIVYSNGIDEFVVQCINDKHIYIEIEDKCNFINKKYESIEEMINVIKKYKIPMIGENYFVKKAENELKETYQNS